MLRNGRRVSVQSSFPLGKRAAAAALLAASLVLEGCALGGTESVSESEIKETTQVELPASEVNDTSAPDSVVALSKSVGELWLLSGGTLSGITEDGLELPGIGGDVQTIGTISKPSYEKLLSLSPDLVMLTEDLSAQKELKAQLEEAKIPVMSVDINCFADYRAVMEDLTARTGREDLYEQNVLEVEKHIEAVKEQVAQVAEAYLAAENSYLAIRVSATKNKVLKSDYFACEIFDDMQLTNIADDDLALDDLSLEAIAAADPEYVFVVLQGQEDEARESFRTAFEQQPVWKELTAVKTGRVCILPKELYQYKPNARWGEAYEYIYEIVYGTDG